MTKAKTPEQIAHRREVQRIWRAKTREALNARKRKWGKENPDKIKGQNQRNMAKNGVKNNIRRRYRYANNINGVRDKSHIQDKQWREDNPERAREIVKAWQKKNPDKVKAYPIDWRKKNPDKIRAINRNNARRRRAKDLNFKIKGRLRTRIKDALRRYVNGASVNRNNRTVELIGCSIENFRIYLESKFEPGMTWDNIHIDHIMPCAIFDLTKPEHRKVCFHFSNLQPLFAADNVRKKDKITTNQFNLL